MDVFKKYKNITPTCSKELIEKRVNGEKSKDDDKEKMIKEPVKFEQNENDIGYVAPGSYPEIVNAMPNRADVKQLKMLVSGRNSELTAILTYLYQHYILADDYPDIANSLEQISIIEMTHYELLSEAIVEFGGDPNLTNGQGDIWTGRNLNTEKNVKKILQDNIKSEEEAIFDYTRAAKQTSNESLANLYLRIAEDEKQHIVVLTSLLNSL